MVSILITVHPWLMYDLLFSADFTSYKYLQCLGTKSCTCSYSYKYTTKSHLKMEKHLSSLIKKQQMTW